MSHSPVPGCAMLVKTRNEGVVVAAFRLMVCLYLAVLGVIATLGVYVLVQGATHL